MTTTQHTLKARCSIDHTHRPRVALDLDLTHSTLQAHRCGSIVSHSTFAHFNTIQRHDQKLQHSNRT